MHSGFDCMGMGFPTLHNQHIAQQQSWINSQRDLHATGVNKDEDLHLTAEENFNHFTGVLGNPLDTEKQVRTLFELAKNTGLTLSKAEYKLAEEKNGRYRTYQILLPVKGSYNSIRRFCEKTLLAIPFASLDEMSFKRESIASGSLEARLRFTLYLSESDTESLKQGHSDLRSQKETP